MAIAEGKEIGTGAIFILIGPLSIRSIKRVQVVPVNEVRGPKEACAVACISRSKILVSEERIIHAVFIPCAGIENSVFRGGGLLRFL